MQQTLFIRLYIIIIFALGTNTYSKKRLVRDANQWRGTQSRPWLLFRPVGRCIKCAYCAFYTPCSRGQIVRFELVTCKLHVNKCMIYIIYLYKYIYIWMYIFYDTYVYINSVWILITHHVQSVQSDKQPVVAFLSSLLDLRCI